MRPNPTRSYLKLACSLPFEPPELFQSFEENRSCSIHDICNIVTCNILGVVFWELLKRSFCKCMPGNLAIFFHQFLLEDFPNWPHICGGCRPWQTICVVHPVWVPSIHNVYYTWTFFDEMISLIFFMNCFVLICSNSDSFIQLSNFFFATDNKYIWN